MISLIRRITNKLQSERFSAALVILSTCLTAAFLAWPEGSSAHPPSPTPVAPVAPPAPVTNTSPLGAKLTGALSQTKLVQGSDGTFYLQITVDSPTLPETTAKRNPADLIVVLDQSGSMEVENRMPYAKSAIQELLSRLQSDDRFALVAFDTTARIITPLSYATESFRSQQREVVSALKPLSSTNLSGGLELAKTLLDEKAPNRARKILLLSDGEANVGITDPSQLAILARSFGTKEAVLSTIGMGLDFNESLMASLADHGMGNYSYLENLASLSTILSKDLENTRSIFASSSSLDIKLPSGFQIIDAGGYPQESDKNNASITHILTGQILGGNQKKIYLTLKAPTQATGTFSIEDVALHYTTLTQAETLHLDTKNMQLAVVEQSHESEAIASINDNVYRDSWLTNNLGKMQQEFSRQVKAGNAPAAASAIQAYKSEASSMAAKYRIQILSEKDSRYLDLMGSKLDEAQSSDGEDKAKKQNRLAKEMLSTGRTNQMAH